jgi:hypothetical protein
MDALRWAQLAGPALPPHARLAALRPQRLRACAAPPRRAARAGAYKIERDPAGAQRRGGVAAQRSRRKR